MEVHISGNADLTSASLAAWISDYIEKRLLSSDRFTWALSGGNSPKHLYELLAASPYREKIPWNRIHFFFGDERYVPFNDERNNGRMAFDTLLKNLPVPYEQIHFLRTDMDAETSAAAYEKLLHHYFDGKENSFDLTLLGMGNDGHTLSIFPQSELIHEKEAWVTSLYVPEQEMQRLTLLPPIVNRSREIVFLVTGKDKAETLENILKGNADAEKFPALAIHPASGELHWFVDEAAASLL